MYYLYVYLGLAGVSLAVTSLRSLVVVVGFLRATKGLYENMMNALLKAPTSFFDTTPLGRLLNRLSKDTQDIDDKLPALVQEMLVMLFGMVGVVVVISMSMPVFLLLFVP